MKKIIFVVACLMCLSACAKKEAPKDAAQSDVPVVADAPKAEEAPKANDAEKKDAVKTDEVKKDADAPKADAPKADAPKAEPVAVKAENNPVVLEL